MSDTQDQPIAVNVRLKSSESSLHPRAANYTNVAVAQGWPISILASSSRLCWR